MHRNTSTPLGGWPFSSNLGREPVARSACDLLQCVFITCFSHDFKFFQQMLSYSEIRLHRAETLAEADFLLTVTGSKVLICDTVFLDGSWVDALEMLGCVHPRSSFVVAADPVDIGFVEDAVDRGACAVLWKPLDWAQLMRLIRTVHEAALERCNLDEAIMAGTPGGPSCAA
jgi:DNA-binding NtrC family response regulator